MKQAKNLKVGDVIQFPRTQFAKLRKGWNGWLFSVGIVEKLYVSQKGVPAASVRWCSRIGGRYQLFPCEESVINIRQDCCFEYPYIELDQHIYRECIEAEKNGEQVCWDERFALLASHGFIKD